MNKTLKILMAIILFAVVLSIATSVNAAWSATATYKDLDEAVAEEKDHKETVEAAGGAYTVKIEKTSEGYYKINDDITLTETMTVNSETKILLDADLTVTNGIVVKGKLVVKDGATGGDIIVGAAKTVQINSNGILDVKGSTINNVLNKGGKVYSNGATLTAYKAEAGILYSVLTDAFANCITLGLDTKEFVIGTTEYKFIIVPEDTAKDFLKYTFKSIVPKNESEQASKVEAGKVYVVAVEATYAGLKIKTPTVSISNGLVSLDNSANCGVANATKEVTVNTKDNLSDDKTVRIAAFITGYEDETKLDMVVGKVGSEIEKPADPADKKPEEDKKPEVADPDKKPTETDKNSGLDDEAEIKTGDYIIPATALLAVVVVANVVYFAKAKRS